jgi:hypothetical protein
MTRGFLAHFCKGAIAIGALEARMHGRLAVLDAAEEPLIRALHAQEDIL